MNADSIGKDRFRGCLLGLAAGDAVGTTVEFHRPGTFPPVTDMVGGGPFDLQPGEWTDDTSMALCLGASLLERQGFDPVDQLERYLRWYQEGYWSSTGECFDIGSTVRQALQYFQTSRLPFCGETSPYTAGNGSLMRLAPVAMYYAGNMTEAVHYAGESSRTTHGAPTAVEACRFYAALLVGALCGESKETLLAPDYFGRVMPGVVLHPEIALVAEGSYRRAEPPVIAGTGFVVRSLEAALWAFHRTANFAEGCLQATNLGDDADTTAAIYGQLAGAFYGEAAIPQPWREKLAKAGEIGQMAERLRQGSGALKKI